MNNRSLGNYQMQDFVTDESFINYCLRNNADDRIFWEDWLINHPEKKSLAEEAKKMLSELSLTLPESEYQKELQRMRMAIKPAIPRGESPSVVRFLNWDKEPGFSRVKSKKSIRWIIPGIVLFLTVGWLVLLHSGIPSSRLAERYNNGSSPLVFTLSDSTVVSLAQHSGLRYPRAFGEKERKVYLNGEASFHVSRDASHPFKVYEGDMVATVLGTIFTIKNERKDSVMLVELLKGKLQVQTIGSLGSSVQSIILNPNERVVYTRYDQHFYKEAWNPDDHLRMLADRLVFKKNNFEEIAKKIYATFGITLINQSNKKNWRFTGEFAHSTAGEIIENICQIEGLSSELHGDTVFIK